MLVICLAVASSLGYGVGDFAGGLAARRAPVLRVVAVTLLVSLAFEVALLPAVGGRWSTPALLWGGASGWPRRLRRRCSTGAWRWGR